MDRHTEARKVSRIIYQHGAKMSPRLMDSALDLWERLMKSGNITVDTSAADRRREEREREEAKLGNRRDTTGRAYKVRYGTGRTLAYQIGNDGELIVTPDKAGIYTPKDYKAMLEAITRDIERRERSMEKSKKTGTRWSRAPMLLKKPMTTTTKRWEQPQPKAKTQAPQMETKMQVQPQPVPPAPQAPIDSRGKYDLSRLDGFQIAGMRAGLDPMTPGLETMTFDQMKALAADQAASSVAGLAEKANLAYVRDPRPRKW